MAADIHENASENIICEMAAILSRERWVNRWRVGHEHIAVNIFQMHFREGELMYLDGNFTDLTLFCYGIDILNCRKCFANNRDLCFM